VPGQPPSSAVATATRPLAAPRSPLPDCCPAALSAHHFADSQAHWEFRVHQDFQEEALESRAAVPAEAGVPGLAVVPGQEQALEAVDLGPEAGLGLAVDLGLVALGPEAANGLAEDRSLAGGRALAVDARALAAALGHTDSFPADRKAERQEAVARTAAVAAGSAADPRAAAAAAAAGGGTGSAFRAAGGIGLVVAGIQGRPEEGIPEVVQDSRAAGMAGRKGWAGRKGDGAAIPEEASLEDIPGAVVRTSEACKERRALELEAPTAPARLEGEQVPECSEALLYFSWIHHPHHRHHLARHPFPQCQIQTHHDRALHSEL